MKTILVVDDDPVSRGLIRDILAFQSYDILEADSGQQALDMIEHKPPDLVLMDLQMPRLDGYQVLARLRRNLRIPTIPIAAVTALAMPSEREKALSMGFNAFITKPINPASLRFEVRTLLG